MSFMSFLESLLLDNPLLYLLVLFIYCFLAAVILPIPVELGLLGFIPFLLEGHSFMGLDIFSAFLLLALMMGLGKAVGSWVVFFIGVKIEDSVRLWFKWKWFKKLTDALSRFCERFGYIAIYFVLSVPLMPDTIPLYIFSLLNKDGEVFDVKWFVFTNFWAGITRALIIGISAMLIIYGAT